MAPTEHAPTQRAAVEGLIKILEKEHGDSLNATFSREFSLRLSVALDGKKGRKVHAAALVASVLEKTLMKLRLSTVRTIEESADPKVLGLETVMKGVIRS